MVNGSMQPWHPTTSNTRTNTLSDPSLDYCLLQLTQLLLAAAVLQREDTDFLCHI